MDKTEEIRAILGRLEDPDVGIDIVALGLVQGIDDTTAGVAVRLLMTSPACPQAEYLRDEAERLLHEAGFSDATVAIDADAVWSPDRLSAEARARLGWQG